MLKKFLILSIILTALTGCIAMFVPNSSDPSKLIGMGTYHLQKTGRGYPASIAFDKAIKICHEQKNKECEAEAHLWNGMLYKNAVNLNFASPPIRHEGMNRFQFSEFSFKKSIELWEETQNYNNLVASYFGLANLYAIYEETKNKSCPLYDKSLFYDAKAKRTGNEKITVINPNFKNFKDMILAFKKELCVNNKK